jgi:TonB family protein
VARSRRYRTWWGIFPALVASLALQAGGVAAFQALRPEPPLYLRVELGGEGIGTVLSAPGNIRCTIADGVCGAEVARGTVVTLTAVLGEGSTFEGWSKSCTVHDWVLTCSLTVEKDTVVAALFGVQPKRIEVAWAETGELPPSEKPPEFTVALPDPEIEAEKLLEPEALPPPSMAVPPPPPPPPPPLQPPPPPPPQTAAKQKEAPPPPNSLMVEVPDENEVEKAPDDATALSDKNRDVAEETAAKQTNLEKEQKGTAVASEKSDVQSEEIGAEKTEIAQLETTEATDFDTERTTESDHSGDDKTAVGAIVGEAGQRGDEGEAGDGKPTKDRGKLAMREIGGRGSLAPDQTGEGGKKGRVGTKGAPGVKTQLAFEDYERIVGKDKADAERTLARRTTSAKQGRWEKKLGAIKSALENFTPDVRPGNQTALKTRASPFAVYLARMHRRIHELWGFGFLEDLDSKPSDSPMNNWDLWTNIEISVNPDGSVNKVTIVRSSGVLEFDVAALDTVMSGAPYDETPEAIRSVDGKVYMRWGFYRNWRQCGTFNAEPYILTEVPGGGRDQLDDSVLVAGRDRKGKGADPAPSQGATGAGTAAGTAIGGGSGAPAGFGSEGSGAGSASVPQPEDPEAVHTANLWVSGFATRQLDKMVQVSLAPFTSGDQVVANSAGDLTPIYATLLSESGALKDWRLLSVATYRKKFGEPPPQVAAENLLLVIKAASEQFTLVLAKQADGSFRVVGLHR